MFDFSDLLTPETVVEGVTAANKKALLHQLGAIAARGFGLDAQEVTGGLVARERIGSTGFGGGVAIPHARLDGLTRIVAAFVRLDSPIEFGALDDLPVDLVFMLVSPSDAGADHLKALARVSRALRDRELVGKLRGAASPDALFALLTQNEARDAA